MEDEIARVSMLTDKDPKTSLCAVRVSQSTKDKLRKLKDDYAVDVPEHLRRAIDSEVSRLLREFESTAS